MKILQVNCVYNKGSTGKIVHDIHVELQNRGIESIVCYGRGEKIKEPHVYKTCGELYSKMNNLLTRFTGVMYGGCFFSTNRLISIIKTEKPDIVHLHCINGYFVNIYRLVTWLKKNHVKTLLTLHAEFMYTANCGYAFECERWKSGCGNCPKFRKETKSVFLDNTAISWKKMQKAFDGFNDELLVSSVSHWLMGRAKDSVILGDKRHDVVMNGLDETIFCHNEKISKQELAEYAGKKIIFHVTASFSTRQGHIKGGFYIFELAKRMSDCLFIVAGPHEDIDNVPANVILLGTVSEQKKLAEYYNFADITVVTSKKETFGMPIAESLCCGTPVVGFVAGGPESIGINEYSKFSEYGNLDILQKNIEEFLAADWDRKQISKTAIQKYSKAVMTDGYLSLYRKIVDNT